MIKPLHLGNKTFPVNIIQGPLAGISCAPFRLLTWRYSKPAFSCTEMISCKTLIHKPLLSQKRFIEKDPHEGPVCFQLSSNNPQELGEAVKIATDYGADLIDLNCGCPVKKIRSKGAGSSLLENPTKLYSLIKSMKDNTHVPVSIKIRLDNNQELIKIIKDSGLDFLIVHGRHWTQHYETPCRHDDIQYFVENLKIPVIGNGDIFDNKSLNKMLSTNCAGVMIGRAGVGQPWLINNLLFESSEKPSQKEIGLIFIEHVERLIKLLNNEKFAVLQARAFAKYYAKTLENKKNFCDEINNCDNINNLKYISEKYYV